MDESVAHLRMLLETERDLLRSGRAKEAVALIEDKSQALRALEAALNGQARGSVGPERQRAIAGVIRMAAENALHFEAVRNGLRSAISRLEGLHANAYVGAYGENGAQLPFSRAFGRYRSRG